MSRVSSVPLVLSGVGLQGRRSLLTHSRAALVGPLATRARHLHTRELNESLFSRHKQVVVANPADLDRELAAFFSTLADEKSKSAASPSASSPSASSHSAVPPKSTATSEHTIPPSYTQHAMELSQAILSALNPHAQMSTSARIRNIMAALFGCLAIAGIGVYIFRDEVKGHLSEQTADVAKRSLSSEDVQSQVNQLSSEVVRKLLNDPVIMSSCLAFLQTLFASPDTKASLITLLQSTLKDPATLVVVSALASDLLKDLIEKPETLQQLTELLRRAITEPGNEAALQVLLNNLAKDEKTQQIIARIGQKRGGDDGRTDNDSPTPRHVALLAHHSSLLFHL